jgi:ubiquitin C-terminal hydrolase
MNRSEAELELIEFISSSQRQKEDSNGGKLGLDNLGNTCYLAASLQALNQIPLFSSSLDYGEFASRQATRGSMAVAMRDITRKLWHPTRKIGPAHVLVALRQLNPMFEGFSQHDSHEALRTILNALHDSSAVDIPIDLYSAARTALTNSLSADILSKSSSASTTQADLLSKNSVEPSEINSSVDVALTPFKESEVPEEASAEAAAPAAEAAPEQPPEEEKSPLPDDFIPPSGREWLRDGPYTGPEIVQRSVVSDSFGGALASRVRCRQCRNASVTYDSFYDLSLPIPRSAHPVADGYASSDANASKRPAGCDVWQAAGMFPEDVVSPSTPTTPSTSAATTSTTNNNNGKSDPLRPFGTTEIAEPPKGLFSRIFCAVKDTVMTDIVGAKGASVSLGDCLFSFCDWEPLTGTDQYFCEHCKCKVDADKRMFIACLPEVLCIHLKRFSYYDSWGRKNSTFVQFPLRNLDLSPFLLPPSPASGVGNEPQLAPSSANSNFPLPIEKARALGKSLSSGHAQDGIASRRRLSELSASPVSEAAYDTAKRSYIRAKEQQIGKSFSSSRLSSALASGATDGMSPEVRASVLHRHALATGYTGVEDIVVAYNAHTSFIGAPSGLVDKDVSKSIEKDAPTSSSSAAAVASSSSSLVHVRSVHDFEEESDELGPRRVPPYRHVPTASLGTTKYDLVSVVQHMGSMGGGHYIAHAKHKVSGQWHTYNDSVVTPIDEAQVLQKEAYVLFYVKQKSPSVIPGSAPESASRTDSLPLVKLPPRKDSEPVYAYVSRFWWIRYASISVPGPVTNADIICDHGALKPQLASDADALSVPLSEAQYACLAKHYGVAEPPLTSLQPCKACHVEKLALARRRQIERQNILQVDTKEGEDVWFIMSEVWLDRWRKFIHNEGPSDGTNRGILPPGPIDNARLLNKEGKPIRNLVARTHYRCVNNKVWNFLVKVYGGGPCLMRRDLDIYSEPVLQYPLPAENSTPTVNSSS